MKRLSPQLFNELRSRVSNICVGWLVTRRDGLKVGFTTSDVPFTYQGLEYSPAHSFSASAIASKADFSMDNVTTVGLISDVITKQDLLGGVWDNAQVEFFWIRPDKPEWGVMPLRGGKFGQIKCTGKTFEVELLSVTQYLQQPFGKFYTLECRATLGDQDCKVKLDVPEWTPNTVYIKEISGEAGIGDIVAPTTPNGFWYVCDGTPNTVYTRADPATVPADVYAKLLQVKQLNRIT